MLKLTLVPNREDRPRYVTLIKYEQRWVVNPLILDEYNEPMEVLGIVPLRRTLEWVRTADGYESFMCTRVTELPWRALKPQQAHRELAQQWKEHLATLREGARPVQVEVVP